MEEERNIGSESQEAAKNLLQDESTRNKLLIESLGVSNSLVDTLKEALGINIRRSTEDSNLLNINKRINKAIQGQLGDLTNIDQFQKQIVKNEKLIAEGNTVTLNLSKSLVNNELENSTLSRQKADSVVDYIKQIQEAERLATIEQQKLSENKNLSEEEAKIIATRVKDLKANVNAASALLDKRFESLGILQRQYVVSKLNTEQLEKQNDLLKESQKNASGATFLSEVIGKIPGLGNISKKALGEVNEELVETVANGQKLPSSFKTSSKFVKNLGSGIANATKGFGLLSIVAKAFVEGLLKADTELVEIQKSFVQSRSEAMGLRMELATAAAESGNINITTSKLLTNITELSKEFGFVAKFSSDTLVTMTKLTEQVGLTAQEAAQLAAAAEISDQSFEDIYQNVLGASYELQQQAGVQFDLREILKAVNSVTGQVRANLAANPEAIAKAVTEAKLFGAQLDDIVGASRALLDFQSSIEKELEAELLLGRDLNLERARSAALLGDQETVAKELAAQAQDFTTFTKLNVLQQDALASSLGMQSDQLADILFKQEVQNKTARELRALGKDELADRLESQTLADKFNATIEKLKGIFADVGTAFFPILQLLGDALSIVNLIVAPITDLIQLLVAFPRALMGAEDAFSSISFASPGAYGFGEGGLFDMNDGIIPPSGEGSIISRPEGSIKLNPKDTIVAGTDLFSEEVVPQTPDPSDVSQNVLQEFSLSQLPDYEQVLNETKFGDTVSNVSTQTSLGDRVSNQTNLGERVSNVSNQTNLGERVSNVSNQTSLGERVSNVSNQTNLEERVNNVSNQTSLGDKISNVSNQSSLAESISNFTKQSYLGDTISNFTRESSLGDTINKSLERSMITEGDTINSTSTITPTQIENIQPLQAINQMQAPIAPTETSGGTLIQELIAEQKRTQEAIKKQTQILSKGQDTIAKTKTKLQVGATDFGTELNVNSFRIQ